jgi:hypothetical protein
MTEDRPLREFVLRLNAEIRERAAGLHEEQSPNFKENVFAEVALENLSEIGAVDSWDIAFFEGRTERGIAKVNAYGLNEDGDALDLFTCVFLDAPEPMSISRDDLTKAVERAARFGDAALNALHGGMEAASDAYAMARAVYDHRHTLARIRVFVLTDGVCGHRKMDDTEIGAHSARVEVWDAERLFRSMQAGLPRDEISIDFIAEFGGAIPCLPMPTKANEYMAYLAILPADVLYRLYEEYGPRLLEFNVRSFLSARGRINSGIRKTLKEAPDRFMAYNNGIVATVDALQLSTLSDGRPAIASVKGLQIVNGGQTTASIHRAKKVDRADIASVFVPTKITLIKPEFEEEIVRQVSRFANTQNVIQMADFSANDPFHIEVERLSHSVWAPGEQNRWFYERARGQYQDAKARLGSTPAQAKRFLSQAPPNRKFTKTDVAKYQQSWAQRPYDVSLGAQKNFERFMQDLRVRQGKDWLPDEAYYHDLIAKAIVFKAVERLVRQEKFPAYRANIVTYVVAYLSYRSGERLDLSRVWMNQVLSRQLEDLLRQWSHRISSAILESAAGRNVTEWCKKEACWNAITAVTLEIGDPMPEEFSSEVEGGWTETGGTMSADDYENIERCKKVDGETWLKLHAWGSRTGVLQKWQAGIAHTLASYAANGWSRSPSPKQARQAVKILNLAAEHDVLRPVAAGDSSV